MKIRVLGFLMVLIGLLTITYGISFLSVAESEGNAAVESVKPELKAGTYYLNANSERECIEIFDRVMPDYKHISSIKKIDSILWSIR